MRFIHILSSVLLIAATAFVAVSVTAKDDCDQYSKMCPWPGAVPAQK